MKHEGILRLMARFFSFRRELVLITICCLMLLCALFVDSRLTNELHAPDILNNLSMSMCVKLVIIFVVFVSFRCVTTFPHLNKTQCTQVFGFLLSNANNVARKKNQIFQSTPNSRKAAKMKCVAETKCVENTATKRRLVCISSPDSDSISFSPSPFSATQMCSYSE